MRTRNMLLTRLLWQDNAFNLDAFLDSCGGDSDDYLNSSLNPVERGGMNPCPNTLDHVFCTDITFTVCYCVPPWDIQSDTCDIPEGQRPDGLCTGPNDECYVDLPNPPNANVRLVVECNYGYEPHYGTLPPTVSPAPTSSPAPTKEPTPAPTPVPIIDEAFVSQVGTAEFWVQHGYKNPSGAPLETDSFALFYSSDGAATNNLRRACPGYNPSALTVPTTCQVFESTCELQVSGVFQGVIMDFPSNRYTANLQFHANVLNPPDPSVLWTDNLFGDNVPYLLFCVQYAVTNAQGAIRAQRETVLWLNADDKSLAGSLDLESTDYLPTSNPTQPPTPAPTVSPTMSPSKSPSQPPTRSPSLRPTVSPTKSPSKSPTRSPSRAPTNAPTLTPSISPTRSPSRTPTNAPTSSPTPAPSKSPSITPTKTPSSFPTSSPSSSPTAVLGRCIHLLETASPYRESTCTDAVSEQACSAMALGRPSAWKVDAHCPTPNRMRCPPKRRFKDFIKAHVCMKRSMTVPCHCDNGD